MKTKYWNLINKRVNMSRLNDSVIICSPRRKSQMKEKILTSRKRLRKTKCTSYESPLIHIRFSSERRMKELSPKELFVKVKTRCDKTENCPLTNKDSSLQDSIIILSDNECEANIQSGKNKCKRNGRAQKRPLGIFKESKQCSHSSREEDEEIPAKRRKGKSPIKIIDNNSSCYLVSDTEDLEITSTNLIEDYTASVSKRSVEKSDDIVVLWSSTNSVQSQEDLLEANTADEKSANKLFLVDCNPNLNNLNVLKSNEQELYHGNLGKENNKMEKQEKTNMLPFNKKGLKFPKAHNISKKIVVKTPQKDPRLRILNRRTQRNMPLNSVVYDSNLKPVSAQVLPDLYSETFISKLGNPELLLSLVESTKSQEPNKLREIVVDGNNVAMMHKNGKTFSEEGIALVIDYFKRRGHSVKVFVPQYRRSQSNKLLEKLYVDGTVVFTPSRNIGKRWITPYDDRYILEYATMCKGIVVSADQYRDLYEEKPEWRDTIENRLLTPTFVGDYVMFPEDPLGRNGPKLDAFLRF